MSSGWKDSAKWKKKNANTIVACEIDHPKTIKKLIVLVYCGVWCFDSNDDWAQPFNEYSIFLEIVFVPYTTQNIVIAELNREAEKKNSERNGKKKLLYRVWAPHKIEHIVCWNDVHDFALF